MTKTLVVGAGATGGYVGSALINGGRDVTFLVRGQRQARLDRDGLVVRHAGGHTASTPVRTITRSELNETFDIIIIAVRAGAVEHVISDVGPAVSESTVIVPVVNGIGHLDLLSKHFGARRILGATAKLLASLRDGVIVETRPGIDLAVGAIDSAGSGAVDAAVDELRVDGLTVEVSNDIVAAMWSKFAFITATSALTCLARDSIGAIAKTDGGTDLAYTVLTEVGAVVAAEGHPLSPEGRDQLRLTLTDPVSTFAPSMFRDVMAGLPVETEVLQEFTHRARRHAVNAPLLNAALVAVEVHNQTIAAR